MNYKDYIETIPDFPIEGILFRDITPLLANGEVFYSAVKEIAMFHGDISRCVPEFVAEMLYKKFGH